MGKILQNIPFLRILVPLVTGIVLADHVPYMNQVFILVPAVFTTVLFFAASQRVSISNSFWPGIFLSAALLLSGFSLHQVNNKPPELIGAERYMGILLESPDEKPRSFKAEFQVRYAISGDSAIRYNEKIILYFEKDTACKNLMPGDNLLIHKSLAAIRNSGNPYEFDYRKYLAMRKIFRQVYLGSDEWKKTDPVIRGTLRTNAEKLRNKLLKIYESEGITGKEYQVLSALTLGYRKAMDPEITRVYASVGATHVLSVSGLHVGIIYLVLNTLLGFLKKNRKSGLLFLVILLVLLWFYALITGFSPPVLRATIMFSMLVIGDNLRRASNIYNNLVSSATVLLALNSNWLFDTGFQLSYLAITGIVFFQPLLAALYEPPYLIGRYLWGLVTVSLAAQISTLPLIIYYFNQFPVYFLLTNLIIIPLSFLFICTGFLIIFTSFLPILPAMSASAARFLIRFSFDLLHGIENLPGSLIRNIQMSQVQMLLLLMLLLAIMSFITFKKPVYLKIMLVIMLFFTGAAVKRNLDTAGRKKIIVYNSPEYPVIHLINGRINYIISGHGADEQDRFLKNSISNVIAKSGLNEPVYLRPDTLFIDNNILINKNIVCFSGKKFAIVNQWPAKLPELDFDFLLALRQPAFPGETDIPVVGFQTKNVPSAKHSGIYSVFSSGAYVVNF